MRRGVSRSWTWWRGLAVGLIIALGRAAWAEPCSAPTPACHFENGTELLTSDPGRAAEELLASYQLDERTDTLALYATALALDRRYALALDTWKRVIVFRDSELEAAREAARTSTGRKRAAGRAAAARAQRQSEQAAQAIIQLWARVGRVRIRLAPGQQVAVTRDGAPVDPAQDVTVNAGRDELVFTRSDGSVERVAVQVAAGAFVKLDAPAEPGGRSPQSPGGSPPGAAAATSAPRAVDAPAAPSAKPVAPVAAQADGTKPATRSAAAAATFAKPSAASAPGGTPARSDSPAAQVASTKPGKSLDAPVVPSAKPVALVEAVPEATGGAAATVPRPALAAVRTVDAPRSLTLSRVGLGLVAGAVVAGGVAGSFGYLAGRDFDRSRTSGCSADGRCPFGPGAELAEQSNHRARIAQVSAASAVALAATGATLWWVGRGSTQRTVTDVALHVGPSTPSGGLATAVSGRF